MLIDLSHTIEDGMITYKGLPAPLICDFLSREDSRSRYQDAEFQIGKIELISNTGTYVDCPFHRYADGKDLNDTALEKFANLPGVIITHHYSKGLEIGKSYFENIDVLGKAVLIHTDWSDHWRTDSYFENHPFVSEDAAKYLRDSGAKLVGIDSYNIDDTRSNRRPVHSILLAEEILIVEHMCNMKMIPKDKPFIFNAVPPKIKGMGTFPVRAYVEIKD